MRWRRFPTTTGTGVPILIRSDSAGATHGLLAHIRNQRRCGVDARFSVGVAITEPVRQAIATMIEHRPDDWIPALDNDGQPRPDAQVCELTGLVPDDGYPAGTRFIVRRETPHPGAQLSLFDTIEGMRHQVFATDTPPGNGSIQYLEARHRRHARVEDRIRTGKDTGFGRFPSRVFAINAAWLQLALTGIDLLAWTQLLRLDGDLATAEPKKTALPTPARRRPDHPRQPTHPATHRRNLALGNHSGHRVHPARRPTPTRHLNCRHDPTSTHGAPRPRAGPSPYPNTTNTPEKINNRATPTRSPAS
jgi:hypothetical protein